MKNKNKKIVLISLIVFVFVIIIISRTYAYFQNQYDDGITSRVKVITDAKDELIFSVSNPASLGLNEKTMSVEGNNLVSEMHAIATLKANKETNAASINYNVFLDVSKNEFGNGVPIVLNVYDPDGNEYKIDRLNSYSSYTLDDFDSINYDSTYKGYVLNGKTGLINIAKDYNIYSNSSKKNVTQDWKITITFINEHFNQGFEIGRKFETKLIIQREEYDAISNRCKSGDNLNDCIMNMKGYNKQIIYTNAKWTGTSGDNKIIYDNVYRYVNQNEDIENYICFGSNEETCPYENMYQIVGVFNSYYHGLENKYLVKLVTMDVANIDMLGTDGGFNSLLEHDDFWTDYDGKYEKGEIGLYNKDSDWENSNLNKINLNTNFLNYLGNEWADKIEVTNWNYEKDSTLKNNATTPQMTTYINEIALNTKKTSGKIGLIYLSDSYFSSVASYYGYSNYSTTSWLKDIGHKMFKNNEYYEYNAVKPTFYLKNDIKYIRGKGTKTDPIRVG